MEITINITCRDAELLDELKRAEGRDDLTYTEYAEVLLVRYMHILASNSASN